MAEDFCRENECEDGSIGGDDNREHVITLRQVGQAFIAELIRGIETNNPTERESITRSCGNLLESLIFGSVSLILDNLVDSDPRRWIVFYETMTAVTTPGLEKYSYTTEVVSAVTKAEALEIGQSIAKKKSTQQRRVSVIKVEEDLDE